MKRWKRTVAVVAAAALGTAGCGVRTPPSATPQASAPSDIDIQTNSIDPDATGPAREVPGARQGGVLTVYGQNPPDTFDPTDIYFVDSNEIGKLLFRTPTQFDVRAGKPVLVPDLTDVGKVSDDKLTWTFTFKGGRYEDGNDIRVEDLAYAIKRSFAHDIYRNGPTYQLTYFKDGKKYKGPYRDGEDYAGVQTRGDKLIIKLDKPFADLPFYLSFPMFTPIPKASDSKQEYKNRPLATGPYRFESFTPGSELNLTRNPNWAPETDPVRHQYVDGWRFRWGADPVKTQKQVLASNGEDANAVDYANVDASVLAEATGARSAQLVKGDSPCSIGVQIDSRKVPLAVRRAIAKAYPYDQVRKASGLTDVSAERSSTILPPSVPGFARYTPVEDLDGTGTGDPEGARALLREADAEGFALSWYYDNQQPLTQQVSQVRADALEQAGFTVKPIGVSSAELRAKKSDYDAPVNMGQSPGGWCSDWPTGGSWFPVLFRTQSIGEGQSWGMLGEKKLDKKINKLAKLPAEESEEKWAALDEEIMKKYVFLPHYYDKTAIVAGSNVGGCEADPTMGMPFLPTMFLKK
ncbi:ABC transporter [Pilimelia terevasa]|uniref:ABC transporter n=1 Tax=Pilimelia terevasa TaxID=53372 RepID=A0A8J3FDG3_9ACTN|nr:ABC transporter substrate-binding protein [Pilimelia terevasa]GGK12743.1 ABC transporter [Pilimelia terevasa]